MRCRLGTGISTGTGTPAPDELVLGVLRLLCGAEDGEDLLRRDLGCCRRGCWRRKVGGCLGQDKVQITRLAAGRYLPAFAAVGCVDVRESILRPFAWIRPKAVLARGLVTKGAWLSNGESALTDLSGCDNNASTSPALFHHHHHHHHLVSSPCSEHGHRRRGQ